MEDFFPEKTQNVHDFERELREESERSARLIKKENVCEKNVKDDTVSNVDIQKKDIEIARKPIMSMVNKKKITYLPKQTAGNVQLDNVQLDNIQLEKEGDNKNDENNEGIESQQVIDNSQESG